MKALLRRIMQRFKWMEESPHMHIAIGAILIVTGLLEAWKTLYEDLTTFNLGGHHGVTIYGLFIMLKNLPDLFQGVADIAIAEEGVMVAEAESKAASRAAESGRS